LPSVTQLPQIRRILAAIDGSEHSEKAGFFAVELARKYDTKLILLHVVNHPLRYLGRTTSNEVAVGLPLTSEQSEETRKRSRESIDRIGSAAEHENVTARREFLETDLSIVDAIADFAENEVVQIIVVGIRGLSNFEPYVEGSVATGLVSRARCSLVIVQ
jgi:nucleotide-binding universal stress UspA family protein